MREHRRKPRHANGRGPNGHQHDRRSFCRSAELAHAQIVAVEIPDPYGTPSDATAKQEPGLRRDGTQAAGELEWHAPEAPRLVVVRNLRGDQIARMEARHQISEAQFAAGRHYQALHEIAFASALRSCDLTRPVIDKMHRAPDPLSGRQQDAIRRLRLIDGTLAVRLGIDALMLVHAVLLSGRAVVDASRGLPRAKASFWRTAFRLALDEIGGARRADHHQAPAPARAGALRPAGGRDGREGAQSALDTGTFCQSRGSPCLSCRPSFGGSNRMSTTQAFSLGVMAGLTPSLIILAWVLIRSRNGED